MQRGKPESDYLASTLDLLERLNRYAVESVIVGGVAADVHGSQMVTGDVDICAPLDVTNSAQIVATLLIIGE